jgi:hypothetical protein
MTRNILSNSHLLTSTSFQHGFPFMLPSLLSETMPTGVLGPGISCESCATSIANVEDADTWALLCRKISLKRICREEGYVEEL